MTTFRAWRRSNPFSRRFRKGAWGRPRGRRHDRVPARAGVGVHHRPDDLRGRRSERDRAAVLRRYVAAADAHLANSKTRLRVFAHALRRGRIGTLHACAIASSWARCIWGSKSDGEALAAFYAERARGGAGLIVTGGSSVSRVGAGGRNYSFINDPRGAPPLAPPQTRVHDAGGRIALQLFHAGRYAFSPRSDLQPVAPSAVAVAFFARPAARARGSGDPRNDPRLRAAVRPARASSVTTPSR